jgi:hypothetical protein
MASHAVSPPSVLSPQPSAHSPQPTAPCSPCAPTPPHTPCLHPGDMRRPAPRRCRRHGRSTKAWCGPKRATRMLSPLESPGARRNLLRCASTRPMSRSSWDYQGRRPSGLACPFQGAGRIGHDTRATRRLEGWARGRYSASGKSVSRPRLSANLVPPCPRGYKRTGVPASDPANPQRP